MNFKRYHVSKNLFDKSNINYYNGYFDSGNNKIASYPTNAMLYVPIEYGKTYTVSGVIRYSMSINQRYLLTKNIPTSGVVPTRNFIKAVSEPLTFTAESDENYLCIMICGDSDYSGYGSVNNAITSNTANIMLNTGSTALPYEPYGDSWHDIPHYIHKTDTDTITTLPAVLYSNDTTATVGLKSQTVQSSTPSPTSPVMPEGCGERTGNLFDKTDILSGYEIVNNQIVPNSAWGVSGYIPVEQGKYYTAVNTGSPALEYEVIGGTAVRSGKSITTGGYTPSETARFIRINFQLPRIGTVMLNEGSTVRPYEPYGYKIPISSASTTTPVYLGEIESTRRIKKLVLDGTETWGKSQSTNTFYIQNTPDVSMSNRNLTMCDHFEHTGQTKGAYGTYYTPPTSVHQFNFVWNESATVEEWKSYLAAQYAAGTPVTVWYVLANPETAVVNEPLMKIGDYADEVSGISIPVTAGGDTFSVGTTVQPSEVTVNYKGWHPVQSVHEKSRNLVEGYIANCNIWTDGVLTSDTSFNMFVAKIVQGQEYSLDAPLVCGFFTSKPSIGSVSYNNTRDTSGVYSFVAPIDGYIAFRKASTETTAMLNTGSTALPYEPYWK